MEYKCKICKKDYSSYQSLWIHNKKYHNKNVSKINNNQPIINSTQPILSNNQHIININDNKLMCKICNKLFSFIQSRWRHEKKCKIKKEVQIQLELDKVKQELATIKQTTTINNNNSHNTNNINKGKIYNTTNIVKFGSEDILKILNESKPLKILNSRLLVLEECIKTTHFNKDKPEYQNIRISNLRSNVAQIYDGENFNTVNQYSAINELINNHVDAITVLLEENQDKLSNKTIERLDEFIEKINDSCRKIVDENTNRIFKNYKDFKIDKVKNIIYDESKKLT